MKKEIAKKFKEVNDHFVAKFATGDFTVLYQSETNSKIECDGEIFWLWHNYGVDGLISNFDNPIHLDMPEDVKKKVYESITKSNEEEKIQRDIKIMEGKIEELKKKLESDVSVCTCEMPAKVKGKNECWRCKKPFKK
jgi:hypothetical protein